MLRHIRVAVAIAALAIAAGSTPGMMAAQGPEQEAQAGGSGELRANSGGDVANDVYIVQMDDAPVLGYDGGIAGRAATRPTRRRQKIEPDDANVAGYAQYLDARHDAALQALRRPEAVWVSLLVQRLRCPPHPVRGRGPEEHARRRARDQGRAQDRWTRPRRLRSSGSMNPAACGTGWPAPNGRVRTSSSASWTRACGPRA